MYNESYGGELRNVMHINENSLVYIYILVIGLL